MSRFRWGKLLLWLGAFPIAAILAGLFFLVPLPKPVFNLIYVGFISAYGTLLLVLYWRGKMPGVKGKLPFESTSSPKNWKQVIFTLGISIGMFILMALYTRTGWFYTFPLNVRLLWMIIFWIVLAFGNLVQAIGNHPWLTAFCMALLLYWLILPQGVLF